MNHEDIIQQLVNNRTVFETLLSKVTNDQADWKPEPKRWSLLEVVNHLYDEEREDFRKRIELVLNDAGDPWPPIDPEGWVVQRRYRKRDYHESLKNFLNEREQSLSWLNQLESPDWLATHRHPRLGPMSAELLLANWAAHDLFHIRQVTDLHFSYLTRIAAPVSLSYSGWETD